MLSTMQRRQGGPDGSESSGAATHSSSAAPGGVENVSFWSSLSVVDSLFSDDPPTRLGQTMSADHAGAFSGGGLGGLTNGWHHQQSSSAPHQQGHLAHILGGSSLHQQHGGQSSGSHGSLGVQRSSFDEGSFYAGASSSLFSSSPILSPPTSPAIHSSLVYSSEEDHHDVRSGVHHQQQQYGQHLHHQQHFPTGSGHYVPPGQAASAATASITYHANGLHSTNGVMTRKHNYALYAAAAAGTGSTNTSSGTSKYSNPRPGSSGLPNGAGHKHGVNFGGGHYSASSGASGGSYQQFQYSSSGHHNLGPGFHHHHQQQQQHSGGHFRASPPRSQPIHAPPRGSSGLGGSGGYPASPPARIRNSGGLGSMPRSSPPRQSHSYLSSALKTAATSNGATSQGGKYSSGNVPTISLYSAAPTDGNNICFDDDATVLSQHAAGHSPRLSSSPLHGSSSQPIQISRVQPIGGGRSPSASLASSLVVSASPLSSHIGSLRLDDANETSGLLQLPSTTLLRIFSYLSGRDLGHLEQVCKRRLAYLANDDGLWKDLYLRRYKLLDVAEGAPRPPTPIDPSLGDEDSESDEWAWIYSLLQQNERWKDIFKTRHSAEQWRIGSLKMFNGCWGFISQTPAPGQLPEQTLDIFFHRKDIAPDGEWYEDWWLKDTPGVSRSQKCGYWDTFLCGRIVRYKQRAAYAQGRRPQACNISFVGEERRDPITGEPLPALHDAKIAQRSLAAARFG